MPTPWRCVYHPAPDVGGRAYYTVEAPSESIHGGWVVVASTRDRDPSIGPDEDTANAILLAAAGRLQPPRTP